jgi:hypothetical protein
MRKVISTSQQMRNKENTKVIPIKFLRIQKTKKATSIPNIYNDKSCDSQMIVEIWVTGTDAVKWTE